MQCPRGKSIVQKTRHFAESSNQNTFTWLPHAGSRLQNHGIKTLGSIQSSACSDRPRRGSHRRHIHEKFTQRNQGCTISSSACQSVGTANLLCFVCRGCSPATESLRASSVADQLGKSSNQSLCEQIAQRLNASEIADKIAPADPLLALHPFQDETTKFAVLLGALGFVLPLVLSLIYAFVWLPFLYFLKRRPEGNG